MKNDQRPCSFVIRYDMLLFIEICRGAIFTKTSNLLHFITKAITTMIQTEAVTSVKI